MRMKTNRKIKCHHTFGQICVVSIISSYVFVRTEFEFQRDQVRDNGGRGGAKGARGCGREHGKGWGSKSRRGCANLVSIIAKHAAKVNCVDIGYPSLGAMHK